MSALRVFPEWLAANTAAGAIFVFISTRPGLWDPPKFLLFGAIFGFGQWLVLRRYYATSWAWLASPIFGALVLLFGAGGAGVALLFSGSAGLVLRVGGAVAGAYLGTVQALLLRPLLRRSVLLVLSSSLAGILSVTYWVDALGTPESPLWGAVGGAVYGLVTGLALLADRLGADNR